MNKEQKENIIRDLVNLFAYTREGEKEAAKFASGKDSYTKLLRYTLEAMDARAKHGRYPVSALRILHVMHNELANVPTKRPPEEFIGCIANEILDRIVKIATEDCDDTTG